MKSVESSHFKFLEPSRWKGSRSFTTGKRMLERLFILEG